MSENHHIDRGASILHRLIPDAHESERVQASVKTQARRRGETLHKPKKREKAMAEYVLHVDRVFESTNDRMRELAWKQAVDKLLVTMDDVPESYWAQILQLYRDKGGSNEPLTDVEKQDDVDLLVDAQKAGLQSWSSHLEEADYPTWFKVYAWDGMSRLGVFDNAKKRFKKRDKTTVSPYPRLNETVLGRVYDAVVDFHGIGNEPDDQELTTLLKNGNFNNLYSRLLMDEKAIIPTPERAEDVRGEWVQYDKEDIETLMSAAEGTQWCIAGEDMARHYTIAEGNVFHLYHLIDPATGKASSSACASIRATQYGISEISGLDDGPVQNVEPALVDIVNEKANTLSGAREFFEGEVDRRELMRLDRKFQKGAAFTLDELEFIYELQRPLKWRGPEGDGQDVRLDDFRAYGDLYYEVFTQKYTPDEVDVILEDEDLSIRQMLDDERFTPRIIIAKMQPAQVANYAVSLVEEKGVTPEQLLSRLEPAHMLSYWYSLQVAGCELKLQDVAATMTVKEQVQSFHLFKRLVSDESESFDFAELFTMMPVEDQLDKFMLFEEYGVKIDTNELTPEQQKRYDRLTATHDEDEYEYYSEEE